MQPNPSAREFVPRMLNQPDFNNKNHNNGVHQQQQVCKILKNFTFNMCIIKLNCILTKQVQ